MDKHIFSVFKLTRALTMLSFLVILGVSVYSAFIAFDRISYRIASSSAVNEQNLPLIIIDSGHGGEDGGAQSKSGILEKGINLNIGKDLEKIFQFFGFDTLMTRSEDKLIYDDWAKTIREKKVSDIHNRYKMITDNPNCIFLSIHQNFYEGKVTPGTQTFYSGNNPMSEKVAQYIQDSIRVDIQNTNKKQVKKSGKEIYLLYHSTSPTVMVECGFLSEENEAQKLNTEEYQKQLAFDIFKGTYNYLKDSGG